MISNQLSVKNENLGRQNSVFCFLPSAFSILCLLLSTFFISSAYSEEMTVQAQAEAILKFLNRSVGLVHMPDCGNGELALALLDADKTLLIHAQDPDYAKIQAARKTADEKGYYGSRVWFDQGDLKRLLPVANSCDLVIMTNLTDKDLTPQLAKEIGRVLHPWYGIALLTGSVSQEKLVQWDSTIQGSGFGVQGSVIFDPRLSPLASGHFLKLSKAELEGSDDWPLWWHGPGNSPVSEDTAFQMPGTMQWTGKPYKSTRIELPIVAQGRLFMGWNGHVMDATPGEPILEGEDVNVRTHGWKTVLKGTLMDHRGPLLTAQSTGSGVLLWHRRLSPAAWLQVARSMMAACGNVLLVADGGNLLELDQATGKELRTKEFDFKEIKWLSAIDDYVMVLGGTQFPMLYPEQMRRSEKNVIPFRSSGLVLTVLDRKSLKVLWQVKREQGKDAFDPRSPAAENGRLFICSEGGTAEAYELGTGRLAWKVEIGFERAKPGGYEWDRSSRHPVSGYAALGVYIISGIEMQKAYILSQKDGSQLWDMRTKGQNQFMPLAFKGLLSGLDPLTGERKEKIVHPIKESCSRPTMAPFAEESGYNPPEKLKSACGAGNFVADGLIWKFPTPCGCIEWRGFIAQGPKEKTVQVPNRLYTVQTDTSAAESAPKGWLTYRANAERSSFMPVPVPDKVGIRWLTDSLCRRSALSRGNSVLVGDERVPAPPVVADNRIIVAHGDGSVNAFDLKSGKQLWCSYTSGRVVSSPTVWKDRVFVSSCDGFLYSFSLADGREIWRLHVAGDVGRTMVYDQLGSRWPAVSSPIVQGDRVVASAGLISHVDGVYAVCADAETGRILWERNDWKKAEEGGKISGGAQFSCYENTLFYHGGMAPPVRLSIEDGRCAPAFTLASDEYFRQFTAGKWATVRTFAGITGNVKGQDVGFLSRELVAYGGRRIWIDQAGSGYGGGLKIFYRNEKGEGLLPVAGISGAGNRSEIALFPVWDEKDVIFLNVKGADEKQKHLGGVVSLAKEKLAEALRSMTSENSIKDILAEDNKKGSRNRGIPPGLINRGYSVLKDNNPSWKWTIPYGNKVYAYALTENAVVMVLRDHRGTNLLITLSRKDGAKLWDLKLPGRPVYGGMAIAGDGSIVLALLDGTLITVGE